MAHDQRLGLGSTKQKKMRLTYFAILIVSAIAIAIRVESACYGTQFSCQTPDGEYGTSCVVIQAKERVGLWFGCEVSGSQNLFI